MSLDIQGEHGACIHVVPGTVSVRPIRRQQTMRCRAIGVLISCAAVLTNSRALAFCRETTCVVSPAPAGCLGNLDADGCSSEGAPLYWREPCLSFSVHRSGSSRRAITADALERLVTTAFDVWSKVECSNGKTPGFRAEVQPQAQCESVGFRHDGPNQNLWILRDEPWAYELGAESAMALTVLTVDSTSGEIYDADVELNSRDYAFTIEDDSVEVDLYSIVLHEVGHVMGIGHSEWTTSTMASGYDVGSLQARTLETDDRAAICSVMPPRLEIACSFEPYGGFSVDCARETSGCNLRSRQHLSRAAYPDWLLMLLPWLAVRRHRLLAISR